MFNYDFEEKLSNGNTLYYKILHNTYYTVGIKLKDGSIEEYKQVDDSLMRVLNNWEGKGWRVRIWYGDRITGESWNEEYDVTGTISRSSGNIKIPILIHNKRSWGGGAILVGNIVRIDDIEDRRTIWKHKNFFIPAMELTFQDRGNGYNYHVYSEGKELAGFKTENQAKRWIDFMNGKRYSK